MAGPGNPFDRKRAQLAGIASGKARRELRFRTARILNAAAEATPETLEPAVIDFWRQAFGIIETEITALMRFYTRALVAAFQNDDPQAMAFILAQLGLSYTARAQEAAREMAAEETERALTINFITDAEEAGPPKNAATRPGLLA